MRVIVVGAGITGLAAAHRLAEGARRQGRPLELAVLEAEARAGGHAWTVEEDGFRVEGGPNAFLCRPREPETLELVSELGCDSRLVEARPAARRRFLLLGGRLHRAPDSPPALLASGALTAAGKLRVLLEPWARPAPPGVEETVAAFAHRRIGREAAEKLVDAVVAGITAGDSARLSVEAAFPLMVEMERRHGSLVRAMLARRREGQSRLMALDGGMTTLIEALCERLGGAVRTGVRARAAIRSGSKWQVHCEDGAMLGADRVILAVSAPRAAQILAVADAALAATLAAFPSAGLALVALGYRREDVSHPLEGYGYLVAASEELDTLGVVWESALFAGRAPEGCVLLRAMLGGARRPDLATTDEAELVRRARRELEDPLGITAPPLRRWVWRWPHAIAQYEIGHQARVAAARALAARHPGLELCGSSYDGVSFGSAVRSGRRAADRVLAGRANAPAVSSPGSETAEAAKAGAPSLP